MVFFQKGCHPLNFFYPQSTSFINKALLDSEAATMYKLKRQSSNMQTGQGFKYKELVRPAGPSGWSVRLVRPAGTSGWYIRLVRSAGMSGWHVRLVRLAGSSGWYIQLVCIQVGLNLLKSPKVAISCYNVQIETSILEYANWPRLQIWRTGPCSWSVQLVCIQSYVRCCNVAISSWRLS